MENFEFSSAVNYLRKPVFTSTSVGSTEGLDKIIRIATTTDKDGKHLVGYKVADTSAFQMRMNSVSEEFEFRISVLRQVVLSQKKLIEYNGVYNAYLIESITESEFYEEAERFSYEQTNIIPEELSKIIRYLEADTNIGYTAPELMELFQCPLSLIEDTLQLIAAPSVSKVHHCYVPQYSR